MSSAERPEADVAEQARGVVDEPAADPVPDLAPDAPVEDALEQARDAGLPDEDEAPHAG